MEIVSAAVESDISNRKTQEIWYLPRAIRFKKKTLHRSASSVLTTSPKPAALKRKRSPRSLVLVRNPRE